MTVLIFIENLCGGGAERVLLSYLSQMSLKDDKIIVRVLSDIGTYKDELLKLPVAYSPILKQRNSWLGSFFNSLCYKFITQFLPIKLANYLFIPRRGIDCHIAFVEGFATKLISYSPASVNKIAFVHIDLLAHPWPLEAGVFKSREEEIEAYRKFTQVVGVSESVSQIMRQVYGLSNVQTIYNPINYGKILQRAGESSDFLLDNKTFNLVSVGRLVYQKGYDLLIPIVSNLIRNGANMKLYIIGAGNQEDELRQMIDSLGMAESIYLLGYMQNPYPVVKQMDLFVCSSRAEGFSLAMAESLALEVPVVSVKCSGPTDLLDDGRYGLLCDSVNELSKLIKRVYDSPELYETLKEKAKSRAIFFNDQAAVSAFEKLFKA